MSILTIDKKVINGNIRDILDKLKLESHKPYLFKDMKNSGDYLMVTCPFHSGGREEHPSSGIVQVNTNKMEKGFFHCFACGAAHSLPELVSLIFGSDIDFANNWLVKNFGGNSLTAIDALPPIELDSNKNGEKFLDEKILEQYDYYHPYMWERKLTKEVVDKFRVGYDNLRKCLTFPVWDIKGRLKLVTTRSVNGRNFFITEEQDKPVYLLNFIINEGINTVYVTESQINCLTLHGYGKPAIALLGTGGYHQYSILKKSGIRHYIMCLDPDKAGRRGTKRFIENAKLDVFIDVVDLPEGKDVNDLSREEFENCPIITAQEWLQKYGKNLD